MEMLRNCGWYGFVVLGLAVIAVVMGIVALAVASLSKRFGVATAIVALCIGLSVPAMGVVGTIMGRRTTESAIAGESVDPAMRERIRQVGYSEAAQCTSLGAFSGILPGLMSMGSLLIAFVRRASRER